MRVCAGLALVGVALTWTSLGSGGLDGMQGPNNGLLVAVVALFALGWRRGLVKGSLVAVLGVLGAGIVIAWTAIENWRDNRAVLDGGAGVGLLLVVAAGATLAAAALAVGLDRVRRRGTSDAGHETLSGR